MNVQELETLNPYYCAWYDVRTQLQQFLYDRSNEAFAAGDAARDAIKTPAELHARRDRLRAKFIEGLGGLPSSDTPLNARVVGIVNCDGFRIEKVIYESRPGAYVTANLYVPDGITSPRGAVLFLCGHHGDAKHAPEYQIVCQYLTRAGLVVLAQDPVGQGERFSYYEKDIGRTTIDWGVVEHDYAGCQCWPLGDSIARYFVHDAMRGVDYLRTRPEVDPNKIGVTGNSGGGTQSCLMMVCDPRLAAAAPTTFVMNRQTYMYTGGAQDAEQIWPNMTALGFDHEDVLLMMTPKPVRVLAVTSDFFPIEGTRLTVARCKRLWEMYGKADCVDLVEDQSTHTYTQTLARAAAEFFSLHLLGQKVTPSDEGIRELPPSDLWCTQSGQVRGEIPGARFVYEENCDRLTQIEPRRDAVPEARRKEQALTWLRDRVFAYRKPCDLNPRHYWDVPVQDLRAYLCFWWAQDGIFNHAFTFKDHRFEGKRLPVTLAVWDGGTTSLQPHIDWIRKTCAGGRAVTVLDVSGVGGVAPHSLDGVRKPQDHYATLFKFADDLLWLNDSLAAMRTYDVLRALDMLEIWPGLDSADIRAYACGRQGVYAQLAAALDARIKNIEVVGGMGSYAEWVRSRHYDQYDIFGVILPGMLQYFDLPDLGKWTAE